MFGNKFDQDLRNIENDNDSGSSEFVEKVLELYKSAVQFLGKDLKENRRKINDLSIRIINSRPSMATLINTVGFLISDIQEYSKTNINLQIKKFKKVRMEIKSNLKSNFSDLMKSFQTNTKIMLISYSSTINDLLMDLDFLDAELYILESRPLFEGRRTAEILSKKFEIHLIVDAAMGYFINDVDVVLVGIDSILEDGSLINKIGTYPLSVMAKENGIHVYPVGTSLKYNLRSHYGKDILIEEKSKKEVLDKPKFANKGIKVHNYYFDKTYPKYITKLITDLGNDSPKKFIEKAVNFIPTKWFKDLLL